MGSHDETVEFDVPEYDLRRLMNARDPVSCVYAFRVSVMVVVASLFGIRMCFHCPHCQNEDECDDIEPCQDYLGTNMKLMGGYAGLATALAFATEYQGEATPHGHCICG